MPNTPAIQMQLRSVTHKSFTRCIHFTFLAQLACYLLLACNSKSTCRIKMANGGESLNMACARLSGCRNYPGSVNPAECTQTGSSLLFFTP